MDTLAIIKRIEVRIAEIGMSKAEFYEKSGISSASYSQWNTGTYNPSKKKLESAAKCLELDYDYLVHGSRPNKKSPGHEPELDVDSIEYALYGEARELDHEEKQQLLELAKLMRKRRREMNK